MIGAQDIVLQSILDNMPVLFYRIGLDNCLIDTGGSGFSALELDPQQLSGSNLSDVFEPISLKLKSIRLLGRYFCETSHEVANKKVWLFHYLFNDPEDEANIIGFALDVSGLKNSQQSLLQLESENRSLARRMLQASENVRLEVARDLHDELGQNLTAIRALAASMIGARQETNSYYLNLAENIIDVSSDAYESAYDLMYRLRPADLDSMGLIQSLKSCIKNSGLERMGVKIDLDVDEEIDAVDSLLQIVTYRLVQEALTNIAKYAMASEVTIQLRRRRVQLDDPRLLANSMGTLTNVELGKFPQECLDIAIQDDGVGFLESEIESGLGLTGIRERVQALGGKVEITSRKGHGVRIVAQIDIQD